MNLKYRPVSRTNDIVTMELADETLIYDLLSGKAFCLNETSSKVWTLCNGELSTVEITSSIFGSAAKLSDHDVVLLAIDQLKTNGLLDSDEETSAAVQGMSRRDLISKAGVASAIVLPLISVISVPAFQQGSCLPNGSQCVIGQPPFCCGTCTGATNMPGFPGMCA